jgi:hypothetical protein
MKGGKMTLKEHIQNTLLVLMLLTVFLTSFVSLPEWEDDEQPLRGAETEIELSKALFYAIKSNDYQLLSNFIPADQEIKYLQKTASERNKPFFEDLDETGVKERLEQGFNIITRKGIEQNINWATVELVDFETRSCSIELIGCNVTFTIVDQQNKRVVVTYDGIKVKNRWFVFQNLGLVSEEKLNNVSRK